MPYYFRDDIATADLAFEVSAFSLSELFEQAGLALEEAMVELNDLKSVITHSFSFKASSLEKLLFQFLEELIYLKDVDGLLFCRFNFTISDKKMFFLRGIGKGDKLNPKKHRLNMDVKAVTYHLFEVTKKENGTFFARVILDI